EDATLEIPEEIEALDRAYNDRQWLLIKLRNGLKERIRDLLRFYDAVGSIQDISKMLGSVLAGMGLDNEEISDITTDPGLQSLLAALSLPAKEALKLMDEPQRLLYHCLTAMAQGFQTTAVQWILKNPDTFLNIVC